MRNQLSFSDEDQDELQKSAICWWRRPEEFDENGHFKIDISNFSNLTPRIKALREMERLAFVAVEGLEDLRHKLISYRSGDFWLPVGGIKKEDMDIPPVVTILLAGISGSGKSSFINLMYSVLGRSGLIPFAQTSGESSNYTTMFLEEHNVVRSQRSGFCVYDTRGLDQNQMIEGLDEVSTWMSTGVLHNQPCYRFGVETGGSMEQSDSRYVKRKVNCVMVVADLSKIHKAFECGDLKPVEALRDLFHLPSIKYCNDNPILILTHGDTLNAKERINGRLKICEYLGISETTGAYDIPCLTEQGILPEESDPVTAFALTEAIYRALLQSDRTHLPKKKLKDWIVSFLSWIMLCIASFFAILAHFFSQFGHHKNKLKL
ncbi:P-loop containing nucleoside triphosphate hydrolase superfamily protein [Forsythia ovata]|uniref:P-loop containing nucleoside triphosphate hydrolase superfamily protein n=1 Tax=Forsythia ovata TaxID=205694 RepID=A0ABD1P7S4_9LAMI